MRDSSVVPQSSEPLLKILLVTSWRWPDLHLPNAWKPSQFNFLSWLFFTLLLWFGITFCWVFVCLFLCFWFCFRGNWSSLFSSDSGSKLRFSNILTLFPIISTPQMKKNPFKKFARRNSTFIPACMATTAAFTWKGQLVKHHVTLNVLNILKVRYWQALSCLCFPNDPNYIQAE